MNKELKMDEQEIKEMGELSVSCQDNEDNDKVYVTFSDVKHLEYLYRKSMVCKNTNIRVIRYIPTEFFKHFSDLSRHTFHARKSDPRLKTMIRLG